MDVLYIAANFLRSVELNGLSVPYNHELSARFAEICEKWSGTSIWTFEILLLID